MSGGEARADVRGARRRSREAMPSTESGSASSARPPSAAVRLMRRRMDRTSSADTTAGSTSNREVRSIGGGQLTCPSATASSVPPGSATDRFVKSVYSAVGFTSSGRSGSRCIEDSPALPSSSSKTHFFVPASMSSLGHRSHSARVRHIRPVMDVREKNSDRIKQT